MKYGSRLKELIKAAGYGQNEFASEIGVASSTMSVWCNAEYPTLEGIETVCKALDIDLYRFFMTDEDVEAFMGIDPEWLEIGKTIQPYPVDIKNFLYKMIDAALDTVHAALLKDGQPR